MNDLAAAFTKPDRAAGLQPPNTRPRPKAAPTQPAASAAAAAPAIARPETTTRAGTHGTAGRAIILVSVQLRDRLRAVATSKGKTYRDLILDAVEATVDDLPELITKHTGTKTVNTGLFERTVTTTTPSEGKVQVTIRGLTPQHRQVLTDLVQQTGAPSLTALLVAALEAHLPERPRSLRS